MTTTLLNGLGPSLRKERLHLIAIAIQHFAGISYQFDNPGPDYWHQPTGDDYQQPPGCIVLMADSVEDLQTLVTNVHTLSREFRLTINKGKTEVQMISKESKPMSIYINKEKLKHVEAFTYLGGVITDELFLESLELVSCRYLFRFM